jgi:HlyD family secretion protein
VPRLVKYIIGLLVLLVVAGSVFYWRAVSEIAVHVAVPQSNVEVRVFGIGTVEAQVLSRVGFQVSGKVASVHADQGNLVSAGTLLAKLDDDAQRAKLLKSEATKRQAVANLVKVQAQRDRVDAVYKQKMSINLRRQTLAGRGAVSQEAAEDAQAAEAIALSDLKVSEADAAIAAVLKDDAAAQYQLDAVVLAQHELKAPFDARVIARLKEAGSVANAGEALFTLIEPQSIWVKANVDETLAGGLKVGQTAYVRLRSEADRLVEAEIVRIDQESDRVTEERRVYVRCKACVPQHQLRFLGEQAEVEIVKSVIARGLFVSLRLIEGYEGRSGTLWVIEDGRLAKRRLEFGARLLDGRVEVKSEIPSGVALVIDHRPDLRLGRAARAVPQEQ